MLFWDITQCIVAVLTDNLVQHISPIFKVPLKMGPIVCPETIRNHHYMLHNNREEHSSHLLCSKSLISHIIITLIP